MLLKQRSKQVSHDSSGESDKVVVMEHANDTGPRAEFLRRWAKPIFVITIALVGVTVLGLSLASTPTLTKVWSTNADWNSGALDGTVVNNNAVSLAMSATTPSTTASVGRSATSTNLALN